jgi:hypothetical protein
MFELSRFELDRGEMWVSRIEGNIQWESTIELGRVYNSLPLILASF